MSEVISEVMSEVLGEVLGEAGCGMYLSGKREKKRDTDYGASMVALR